MGQRFHPALTAADRARMTSEELAYFTDAPFAHIVAFRDFQRQAWIEARNAFLTGRAPLIDTRWAHTS